MTTPQHRRVRIQGDGNSATTKITDALTGEKIGPVVRYTVTHERHKAASAVIEVLLPDIDLECDAEIREVRREGVDALLAARIPILDQITDLCYAIEKCGASPELTDAVTKASALRGPISDLVKQAIALGLDTGRMSVSSSSDAT